MSIFWSQLSAQISFPEDNLCLSRNQKHLFLFHCWLLLYFWTNTELFELMVVLVRPTYESRLSRLYADFIHRLTLHGGARLVLNSICLECWILKIKNLVKSHKRNCKECLIYKKKRHNLVMSVLPGEIVTFRRPFSKCRSRFRLSIWH